MTAEPSGRSPVAARVAIHALRNVIYPKLRRDRMKRHIIWPSRHVSRLLRRERAP